MKNYISHQIARLINLGSHDYFFAIWLVLWFISDITYPPEYRLSSFVLVFSGSLAFVSLLRGLKTSSRASKIKSSMPFLIILTIFIYQIEILSYLTNRF